jgi:hypothetical protein
VSLLRSAVVILAAEHLGPLAEAEVGGDIGIGSLVEFAKQEELQRAS